MNTDPELAVNYILNPPISEFTRTVRPRVATRNSNHTFLTYTVARDYLES